MKSLMLSLNRTEGIGYETAKEIARCGGRVIIACRSEERAKQAIDKMKEEVIEEFNKKRGDEDRPSCDREAPSINVRYMQLELSSLRSTMDFVQAYKDSGLPLHVLICNAGMLVASKEITDDGYEKHFQVNYLSHFLLTLHLLPLIKQSGPDGRIINVTSKGHMFSEVNLDNIQAQKSFTTTKCYANSKVYQIMSMYQLSKRLDQEAISVFSVHPGFVETNILNYSTGFKQTMVNMLVSLGVTRKPVAGSVGSLIAALDPNLSGKTALYFSEEKPKSPYAIARNQAKQEVVWNYSLQCLKDYLSEEILKEIGMKLDDIKEAQGIEEVAAGTSEAAEGVGRSSSEVTEGAGGETEVTGPSEGIEEVTHPSEAAEGVGRSSSEVTEGAGGETEVTGPSEMMDGVGDEGGRDPLTAARE